MQGTAGSGDPVKHMACGTVMLKLKNLVLHSLNICDLPQLLEDKAFPKVPCEAPKRNMKGSPCDSLQSY